MGNVIWARAISGHPLLRTPAEAAAWQAKFPVTEEASPVSPSGCRAYLLYNFVPYKPCWSRVQSPSAMFFFVDFTGKSNVQFQSHTEGEVSTGSDRVF